MGSSADSPAPVSQEFLATFRAAAGADGAVSFARFMELALYDARTGYYRRRARRVGRSADTDFYTSADSGPIFGELVAAACVKRLGGRPAQEHVFVEIGAEPGRSVLEGVNHPFARVATLRLGDPLQLEGPCVVFSNELFDAQPFVRTVRRSTGWQEIGVRWENDRFIEVEWPYAASEPAPEGYRFDRPLAAIQLTREIARQPWHGLFIAIDYGKTLLELLEHTPAGTARAYHRHRQSNDLLAHPGEQDLTCHLCWDWLIDVLLQQGFDPPQLQFQEAFFIHHALEMIAAISAAEAGRLSSRKLALTELLHPSRMGQKFQVLHALR